METKKTLPVLSNYQKKWKENPVVWENFNPIILQKCFIIIKLWPSLVWHIRNFTDQNCAFCEPNKFRVFHRLCWKKNWIERFHFFVISDCYLCGIIFSELDVIMYRPSFFIIKSTPLFWIKFNFYYHLKHILCLVFVYIFYA